MSEIVDWARGRWPGLALEFWGEGNWRPWPLALWLVHDKVLMYQHDLAEETMTDDDEVLLGALTVLATWRESDSAVLLKADVTVNTPEDRELLRRFTESGHDVTVVPTEATTPASLVHAASPISVNTAASAAKIGNLWITGGPGEVFSNLTNTIEEWDVDLAGPGEQLQVSAQTLHVALAIPEDEAERRAWATVNKQTGGGNKPGGSGRGKPDSSRGSMSHAERSRA